MQAHELISSAQRANLDVVFSLVGKMVDEVGKLAELNARFTQSALEDALEVALEVARSTAEKPQDWIAIQRSIAAPLAEKVQSYSREFFGILSSAQAEVLKAAQAGNESCVRRVQTFVEDATKHAPAGSEAAVAAWNSAIVAANTLYQTLEKTGQQAVEVARSNIDVVAAAASKNAKRAIEQERQAAKR
ncbi:phasin family domain protein [Burkholderia sp. MSHR3999]|uniref:phasin family protein n=1 Tax=Burkholderia sp. MSHR3999 TaxID=1542965 RepID=UPI0005AC595E|nr:phasin family protein [Burkholderia sp. MSHR3999]KIP14385.1 phasin family domain protein [Burkholderia sp. MSHR3999]